jgi:hypothetical protein
MSSQSTSSPTAPIFLTRTKQAATSRMTLPRPAMPTPAQPSSTADNHITDSRSTTPTEIGIFQQSEAEEDDQSIWLGQQQYFDVNAHSDDDPQALEVSTRPGLQPLFWESHDTDSESDSDINYQAQRPTPEAAGLDGTPSNSTIDAMHDWYREAEDGEHFRDTSVEFQTASNTSLDLPLMGTGRASSSIQSSSHN